MSAQLQEGHEPAEAGAGHRATRLLVHGPRVINAARVAWRTVRATQRRASRTPTGHVHSAAGSLFHDDILRLGPHRLYLRDISQEGHRVQSTSTPGTWPAGFRG